MEFSTYSQRILCPFRGMLQTVAVPGGIAESMDGVRWTLFVSDETIISHTGLSEVRYGIWRLNRGSKRSRIRGGTRPVALIEEIASRLIEALEICATEVPFTPIDRFEYWLLDEADNHPIALLASTPEAQACIPADHPTWHPGGAARTEFQSNWGDADALGRLVNRAAGRHPRGIWLDRSDGRHAQSDDDRTLAPCDLPELFLAEDWASPETTRLAQAFLAWQAPWLLQLGHLSNATRERLEQAAWQRPRETERSYRLYPGVCDRAGLTAARVKARLMGRANTRVPTEPFYPFGNE